jgi:phosphonate transport system substrate-binding protein
VSHLRFASYLGDNGRDFYAAVVRCLAQSTGLPLEFVDPPPTPDPAQALDDLDGAFLCGLPYVRHHAPPAGAGRLLAAPVMAAERYASRPVYFSDVIVRADSGIHRWEDLRGRRFAYNQAESFSGYVLPLQHLQAQGQTLAYFGLAVPSGSHAASLNWVENGQADAAAIDSVVLEMEYRQRPARAAAFRVIASLGPAPMPPVIASARLEPAVRDRLARALAALHEDAAGRAVLAGAGMLRFAPVSDEAYNPIRKLVTAFGPPEG